ncbi:gfo/Idh/MocA family oxidoreductase [candidate division KSB1 bacterium]|nr:Gfo/Idh/MocA family oxidoreductase [candidate division KSB1 bacterium]RQW03037.1 MAG: gfo/Idh/MocA family oxidoreductase [candidate division KSB1 bacterium]
MSQNEYVRNVDRRDFLKLGAAGLGIAAIAASGVRAAHALTEPAQLFTAAKLPQVRIGYVGVGGMGTAHVHNLSRIKGAEIVAVCDLFEDRVKRAQKIVTEAGFPKPTGYSNGESDFKNLCARDDIDLVYTATPWEWHVPVCIEAMENGKHAATEVPAALTIDECWQLVETSERTKRYCIMMENCCYDREEMMILNMVRQGLLGEIIHAECGYLHDLRALKFDFEGKREALWRTAHSIKRNANLYPTHGLGPVAQCMNINRGDQFDYLVSVSSPSRGLNLYAEKKFGPYGEWANMNYALGDVNTSIIKTKLGKTIIVIHDCSSPRPYSRINLVQGTKGIARKWPNRIHIEDKSPAHAWEELEIYFPQYEHPLWGAKAEEARGAGHGGMDYIEDYRLITALIEGTPPDLDVYDAAAWSAVTELSEISVANRSKTVDFPDFTRGAWKTREPLGIIGG